MPVKTIGIIPNIDKDINLSFTEKIVKSIIQRGGNPLLSDNVEKQGSLKPYAVNEEVLLQKSDLIIAIGGDGTFLNAARKIFPFDVPILGINLGTLGFLTEVETQDIEEVMDRVFQGNYEIEDRMLLSAALLSGGSIKQFQALNDIVIKSEAISKMISLHVYVNDVYVDTMTGDGIILSTPTGSTAYSLSAGGPIVEPEISVMILTPICTHTLHSRPFIINKNKTIKIIVDDRFKHDSTVSMDGQLGYKIKPHDIIEIGKSENSVKVLKLHNKNFYGILRNKLYCRQERKIEDEI